MAYAQSEFEMTLSTVAGNDPALMAELRTSFADSLVRQIDLLSRARCDGNWQTAAKRLSGLGASFHAGDLVLLAEEALDGAPGDPAVVRKLNTYASRFSASG
ncbi:Hpt domain-containing protein [Erythrobacter alti]|uniref:Hpt domain-containing protein n=1 Tax=Erythrobacter alti TaxID=1896145 RepID=UPI0030F494C0